MLTIDNHETTNIVDFFSALPDPRSAINRRHLLGDVIVVCICAVLANADGPTAIAEWAKLNELWLQQHLELPHGIPAKDTYRRVLSALKPSVFQACFTQWIDSLDFLSDEEKTQQKRLIAIDGKVMRRSHDKSKGLGALVIVSAWASDRGVSLGQVATEKKSNETTAIPQLLHQLNLEDSIVTIDAAGSQKNIARQIVDGQSDYILALKANHPYLFKEVQSQFETHLADESVNRSVSRYEEFDQRHGRKEHRLYYQMTVPKDLYGRKEWAGLKTIGAAIRIYEQNGVEKSDVRYYLSSLRRNGRQFANGVRQHWAIENTLHWSLDMAFREDESRVRDRHCANNLSWLRRLTLSLIKQHPGKESYVMKRRMAGWSVSYLMQILTGKRP